MIALLLVLALQTEAEPIRLTCHGAGAANKMAGTNAYLRDNEGYSASASIVGTRRDAFEDQVDVVISGEGSKIRLPRTMLPPIHGGDGGWFKMKNVNVSDTSISGSAAVNVINSPKIHLDRTTGTISIDGKAGHYQGLCERMDESAPRKF